MVNIMHRKISFEDFQTETIGISVEMVLIDVPFKFLTLDLEWFRSGCYDTKRSDSHEQT